MNQPLEAPSFPSSSDAPVETCGGGPGHPRPLTCSRQDAAGLEPDERCVRGGVAGSHSLGHVRVCVVRRAGSECLSRSNAASLGVRCGLQVIAACLPHAPSCLKAPNKHQLQHWPTRLIYCAAHSCCLHQPTHRRRLVMRTCPIVL